MHNRSATTKFLALLRLPALAVAAGFPCLGNSGVSAQSVESANAHFYQQFQEPPTASKPPPSGVAAGQGSSPPGTIATTEEQTPPPPPASSLKDPVWVMPESPTGTATTPEKVAVPQLQKPPPPPSRPRPSSTPKNTSDLAVTVTDLQVVGADSELQQYVVNTIKTKLGQPTSPSQIQQDVATLLDSGFFATVTVNSSLNANGVNVVFRVQPVVVQSIRLVGAQVLTQAIAEDLFSSQLGAPINPAGLNQAVQRINQWYAQNGYTLARVLTLEPSREGVVTVNVAEGIVGDVKIRYVGKDGKPVDDKGQPIRPRSQEEFIRRQIKLQPGQVFQDQVARADLKRLTALGIFDSINVAFEGDARRTTVIYNLSEAKSRGFNFGAGYNDDLGVYGAISYQDTNFAGLAQKVNAGVQVGLRDVQFDVRFISPYRDTDPGTPGYSANVFRRQGLSRVFDEKIKLPNGSRVRERRVGGGFTLDEPLGPTWSGSLAVNYQNISIRDRNGRVWPIDALGNQLTLSGTGIDDLTTVAFIATRDQRDNPANPGNGSFLSLSTTQTIPIGRGHILGNTVEANYSQYVPVSIIQGLKGDQPQVFAFNVQAGTVFGDLPPYNAFTLGGVNSVRGYDYGRVGSGRSYVLGSAEYRFPIFKFIGGVAFFDVGSTLNTQSDVPGEPGVLRGYPGTGFGGGIGLRINSPIGIIRTELGINNNGETRFHFGFGQRF